MRVEEDQDIESTVDLHNKFPNSVVIIPILNSPIFPGMIAPIILSETKFTQALDDQISRVGHVALNLVKLKDDDPRHDSEENLDQLDDFADDHGEMEQIEQIEEMEQIHQEQIGHMDVEHRDLSSKDIYKVGVLCKVVKKFKLPDGSVNILVHGVKRYRASEFLQKKPLLITKVEVFEDISTEDDELDAYTRSVINQVKKLSEINPYFNEEMKLAILNSPAPGVLADLVAFAISLDIPEAQDFLETLVVKKRFAKLLVYLKREKDVADIQKKISDEVNSKVNKYQREYFLREQLKVIRAELGMDEDDKSKDLKKMQDSLEEAGLPEMAMKVAQEELERLKVIPDSSPEYNLARTYLRWMIDLPWNKESVECVNIEKTRKILEDDHYGLKKPKERILEFLAVRKLKPEYDGTILCLIGPPGVGKTSLGKSIARSLGRKFYRFSLGGMRDEAEIKGHRRTYVGAMPGKILQALKRVAVNNPVIMLDEIDKIGNSIHGDPSSALLEVLDPEQNVSFLDNYLDVPFDLSRVLFISTANYINDIPSPLLDRMEVIELSGYSIEEKISIATKWVIPKQLEKHGLKKKFFSIKNTVLKKLISGYAREPGVRTLEQYIAKLCRKAALTYVSKSKNKKFAPEIKDLEQLLGGARFQTEMAKNCLKPGIVTGLAWTSFGGEILYIETIPLQGRGGFKLTGQLGDVMNESATLAYSYVKKLLQQQDIKPNKAKPKKTQPPKKEQANDPDEALDFLAQHDVHLHLPAGATPKDGPSAGITMALALYSLAMNKKVKTNLAMTGELSLTGRVLPVGGIKEKVLGAKRAGIKQIILPKENEKDLKEVPEKHRKGIKFSPVSSFDEVIKIAIPGS
ncbi:MAG: endopeptidase La [Bacteriovoracaceae bacterium]|nr:endopeptidase La [Bacteriovoracaceae bacterium]